MQMPRLYLQILNRYTEEIMNKDKCQQQENYLYPFITMVFLFFIIGFLTTINAQFQEPLKETFLAGVTSSRNTFATLITFSWFLAYPICGKLGSQWISRYGYKGTLIRGMLVMTIGLCLFFLSSFFTVHFPNAITTIGCNSIPDGFYIFLLGSFVTGASVTILQVVINPYLCACLVRGTQPVQRLAIGGASNSIGTTIAPFFVTGVIFGGLAMDKIHVEQLLMPFGSFIVVIIILTLILLRLPLPDIQEINIRKDEKSERSIWSFHHFAIGVIAIFFYVGVEVCIGANINFYAIEQSNSSPALLATIYWGGMLIGRLVGSTLSKVPPRTQLTLTTSIAAVLCLAAVLLSNPWLLAAVGLFHSIMWGAIFTLSTYRLGKYTSIASGTFMIGVVGGAILPLLQGALADSLGSWRWSWFVVIIGELFMLYYALIGSRVNKKDIVI
jgi:FHS family L-fucose permease-like MFS transporter